MLPVANWDLTHRLTTCCHHCQKLGRVRVSGSVSSKSNNKKVSTKCVVRSKCMDSVKYVVDEERDRWK